MGFFERRCNSQPMLLYQHLIVRMPEYTPRTQVYEASLPANKHHKWTVSFARTKRPSCNTEPEQTIPAQFLISLTCLMLTCGLVLMCLKVSPSCIKLLKLVVSWKGPLIWKAAQQFGYDQQLWRLTLLTCADPKKSSGPGSFLSPPSNKIYFKKIYIYI